MGALVMRQEGVSWRMRVNVLRERWGRIASSVLLARGILKKNGLPAENTLEAMRPQGHFYHNILLRRSDGVRTMPVVIGASKRHSF
jgi:hypothetical protein